MRYFVEPSRVRGKVMDKDGAKGVSVKYLIGEREGATKFYLREYRVSPGGNTPFDRHPYEHEVYILRGRAKVRVGSTVKEVGKGDVVFVPSNREHQFKNTGKDILAFLCVKGAERLYRRPGRS